MYCFKCGSNMPEGSEFCMHCGTKQPIATDQSNSTQGRFVSATRPKKDKFTILCLFFAIGALGLPITLISNIFNNELSFVVSLWLLVGVVTCIPAAILSFIAMILGIKKKKKGTIEKKKFILRVAAFCMAVVLPLVTLAGLFVVGNQLNYSKAFQAYESKDYDRAYELFSNLDDYKDSEINAKECRYLAAVELAKKKQWEDGRNMFQSLASENYKASQALEVYCNIATNAEIRTNMAENELCAHLKDPASYVATSKNCSFVVSPRGEKAIDVSMIISIQYSAKNSFGGRVTDVYECTKNVTFSDIYDFTAEEVSEMLPKSISQIVSDYSNSSSESGALLQKPDGDVVNLMRTGIVAAILGVTAIVFVAILGACRKIKQVVLQQTQPSAPVVEHHTSTVPVPIAPEVPVAPTGKCIGKCIVCGRENVPIESIEVIVAGMSRKRTMCAECAAKYK